MLKHLLVCSLPIFSLSAGWLDRKAEGWAWYEDKEQPKDIEHQEENKQSTDSIETVRKQLEEKLSKAVLDPSETNVRDYMIEQQRWVHQSEKFALAWAKILLQHPELDDTIKHPTSQYGIQLQEHLKQQKRRIKIENLSQNNGLFFIYEGNSKASQAFAEVVIAFSKMYGWEVLPISADGILLPDFPESKLDNGIIQSMNIRVFPSLYVVEPKQKIATPIAFGLATLSDIETNIDAQYPTEE